MIQLQQELEALDLIQRHLEYHDHDLMRYNYFEQIELPNYGLHFTLSIEQWNDGETSVEVTGIEVYELEGDRIDFTLDLERMIIGKIEVI